MNDSTTTAATVTNSQNDFLRDEYLSLRKEVDCSLDEFRKLERNGVLAVAFAYGWLATHPSNVSHHLIWFIPLFVPLCGLVRNWAINRHLRVVGAYLCTIESHFLRKGGPTGWENHLRMADTINLEAASWTFWLLLAALSMLASVFGSLP